MRARGGPRFCTKFHENPTNGLVADRRSQIDTETDIRTDGCGLHITRSFITS